MRNFLKKTIDYLYDKSTIISGGSVIALSIISISKINLFTIDIFGVDKFQLGQVTYYLIVLFAFIFGYTSVCKGNTVAKLEDDNIKKSTKILDLESKLNEVVSETNELFNSYLKLIVRNLKFSHNERISVYKVYNNKFKLLGRSSPNPRLAKIGRKEYPIDKGFIAKGWEEGEFFIDDLPSVDASRTSLNNYIKAVNDIKEIDKEIVESISMKSRSFFVYRLNGYDSNPKAIIVFESLNSKGFVKNDIIESLKGIKQQLVMFIEKNNGVEIKENTLGI